mmetsp:Transcript_54364/g.119261  ORF Transcript_54364/g.119261 Transcript_54364/m.119261 type:complete len:218 (+) Transcript_54364:497-1150(+)
MAACKFFNLLACRFFSSFSAICLNKKAWLSARINLNLSALFRSISTVRASASAFCSAARWASLSAAAVRSALTELCIWSINSFCLAIRLRISSSRSASCRSNISLYNVIDSISCWVCTCFASSLARRSSMFSFMIVRIALRCWTRFSITRCRSNSISWLIRSTNSASVAFFFSTSACLLSMSAANCLSLSSRCLKVFIFSFSSRCFSISAHDSNSAF